MGKKQQPKSVARTTTITPASTSTVLTAFSPSVASASPLKSSLYYAHLLRAPDAHTLRIYEISTGKCISRWASNALGDDEDQEQRVASFEWSLIPAPAAAEATEAPAEAEGKRGKKRRKSDSTPTAAAGADEAARQQQPKLVLALGLENGSILLWSPNGATPITLSHSSSSSPVTALASPVGEGSAGHLWSAHEDGAVRVWDLVSGQLVGKASGIVEAKKWDDLAVRYEAAEAGDKKRSVQLVLSHLSLHVYSLSIGGASKKDKVKDLKTTEIGRCTGHVEAGFVRWTGRSAASPSTSAMEDDSTSDSLSFLSYSPADRFVQFWTLPLSSSTRAEGALAARLALDSGVQTVALGSSRTEEEQIIAAIDSVGKVALARVPFTFPQPSTKGKKAAGVVALPIESEISGRGGEGAGVSETAFGGAEGQVVVCRGGVKPVFESVAFADEAGAWNAKVELEKAGSGLLNATAEDNAGAPAPTRYSEAETSAVRSADAVAELNSDDEDFANSGELDVDMAEPTLADRLKAMNVSKLAQSGIDAAGSDEEDVDVADEDEEEDALPTGPSVPATTLTTTLIQALHSSDAPLLESCLSHTSAPLIRSTVKRLPSGSLVLGLLEALVERLGTGKKGAQGNASVKRARGLIEWVRQVLIVHVGFLVTIPSLVNRLATLHASLTSRLALQPTLIALNGRLELVMSQIDLRQERAAQRAELAAAMPKATGGRKYVEGESDESGSDDEGEMDDEDDEEEGSVEDVVLGSGDEEEMDSEDEVDDDGMGFDDDEDDEDDDEEEGGRPRANGRGIKMGVADLLDLEASDDESDGESDDGQDESDEDSE
ncbi:hypothetical protein BCR35DRAFT_304358 [Leucosporidium creatinivorum]|uniref:Small-subunit processome Utp12 domain-containing protein n=1 Tax=Leucosporidium creatinivorum TaxID=106004 RepID=A0A1Y2FA41_9BASI|nr:hypothetical protein BCR35DRAFT_304358 [Leucosporidium creatinivorum]